MTIDMHITKKLVSHWNTNISQKENIWPRKLELPVTALEDLYTEEQHCWRHYSGLLTCQPPGTKEKPGNL
jgi:hypothetical protein